MRGCLARGARPLNAARRPRQRSRPHDCARRPARGASPFEGRERHRRSVREAAVDVDLEGHPSGQRCFSSSRTPQLETQRTSRPTHSLRARGVHVVASGGASSGVEASTTASVGAEPSAAASIATSSRASRGPASASGSGERSLGAVRSAPQETRHGSRIRSFASKWRCLRDLERDGCVRVFSTPPSKAVVTRGCRRPSLHKPRIRKADFGRRAIARCLR